MLLGALSREITSLFKLDRSHWMHVENRLAGTRSEAQLGRRLLQLSRQEKMGTSPGDNKRWW